MQDKKDENKFTMCQPGSSNTGWFCWCEKAKKSDFEDSVGVGVSLYFKSMKQMIILFVVATILSLPQYFFLYKSDASKRSTEFGFQAMLGNLGWTKIIYPSTT